MTEEVENKCDNEMIFPMIKVDCGNAKRNLKEKALEIRSALLSLTCNTWCLSNNSICSSYDALRAKMISDPSTTEELDEMKKFFDAIKSFMSWCIKDVDFVIFVWF